MAAEERAQEPINPDAGIPEPELDVQARPVDTFVKPASGLQLEQLAHALSGLNPQLEGVSRLLQGQAEMKGQTQAQEAFEKDQGDWDKAVANGDVPSVFNPWARIRARETFGRLLGNKLGQDIESDPQYILENANATTMQAHDTAWSNARGRWEQTNLGHASHSDPLFQHSYQDMAAAATRDARTKAIDQINRNFVTLTGTHLANEMATQTDTLLNDQVSVEEIADDLTTQLQAAHVPELVARGAAAKALDTIARKRNDISVYDIAQNVKIRGFDGRIYNLADDDDFGKLRSNGRNEIVRTDLSDARLANLNRIADQNKVRASVTSSLIETIQSNEQAAPNLKPFQDAYAAAGMGDKISEIDKVVAAIRKASPGDPDQVTELTADVRSNRNPGSATYVTTATLLHALQGGRINLADYQRLQSEVDKRDKSLHGRTGKAPEDVFEAPTKAEDRAIAALKDNFGDGIMGPHQLSRQLNYALYELSEAGRQYLKLHDKTGVDPDKYDLFLTGEVSAITDYWVGKNNNGFKTFPQHMQKLRTPEELEKGVKGFISSEEVEH